MKSFREFAILLLSSFCCIMVHAQKEYNGVITGPHGTFLAAKIQNQVR